MKKRLLLITSMVLLISTISACSHEHSFDDATCTTPKKCSECDETEGESLGHTWEEATCVKAKTCKVCGVTEGNVLGHTWEEATCVKAKICKVCKEIEGTALGHTTDVGVCTKCKSFINESLIEKLNRYFDYANDANMNAINCLDQDNWYSYDDAYYDILMADVYLDSAKSYMEDYYNACENYKELQELKNAAKKVIDSTPTKPVNASESSYTKWIDEYSTYIENFTKFIDASINFKTKIKGELESMRL